MKIKYYRVSGKTCDCEGRNYRTKVLALFEKLKDAEAFKKDWENLWQQHADNEECISPCWYDFAKNLEIELAEFEICEHYHGLIPNINYKFSEELYKQSLNQKFLKFN